MLISELEISKIRLNQSVDVRFDTFPNQKFVGTVKRISPVADSVARLIPVEVVVPNRDSKLGSGQLARVQFRDSQNRQIVIAETALETAGRSAQKSKDQIKDQTENAKGNGNIKNRTNRSEKGKPKTGTVFVITGDRQAPKVTVRRVTLGDRRDGKVAVVSGLNEGDRIVVRSGGKLQDGDAVRISVLSEPVK